MEVETKDQTKFVCGPTIKLFGGTYFSYENPEGSSFGIHDIAHALSNLCRFAGHCRSFYSVAQHSVLVSQIVPPCDAMAGLLHDAPEAFMIDLPRPLKQMCADYRAIEKRIERAVLSRFGISHIPQSVKDADMIVLRTEQRDLMWANNEVWQSTHKFKPMIQKIEPLGPNDAWGLFCRRYIELQK